MLLRLKAENVNARSFYNLGAGKAGLLSSGRLAGSVTQGEQEHHADD